MSSGREKDFHAEKAAWPWHSCVGPSSFTSGQHWPMEPCPLWLFADALRTRKEKPGKAPLPIKSKPQALSRLLESEGQLIPCLFVPRGF